MKNGRLILWNAIVICVKFKTSWQMRKHLMTGDFENHFKGPIILSGAMVEYHPISAKDQSRLHQLGKNVFHLEYSSDMSCMRGESAKETFWSQTLRSWRSWARQKSMLGDSLQRKF